MDAPAQMYFPQMLMLLLLLGVCTFWLGRMAQWRLLRKKHPRKKIMLILVSSIFISYLLALVFWFCWPQKNEPMWSIFFLPAVIAEVIILITTLAVFIRKKPGL